MTPADRLVKQIHRDVSPLKWERVRRGLRLRQVAEALGFSTHTQLDDYERGRCKPLPHTQVRIAEFYGTTAPALFDRTLLPVDPEPRPVSRLREKLAAIR